MYRYAQLSEEHTSVSIYVPRLPLFGVIQNNSLCVGIAINSLGGRNQ